MIKQMKKIYHLYNKTLLSLLLNLYLNLSNLNRYLQLNKKFKKIQIDEFIFFLYCNKVLISDKEIIELWQDKHFIKSFSWPALINIVFLTHMGHSLKKI